MARLITLLETHWDRQPPTVVTQAMTWWETVIALVKLQEIGLRVHLPVQVHLLLINLCRYVVTYKYVRDKQLLTVVFCQAWPMAVLVTALEQHTS